MKKKTNTNFQRILLPSISFGVLLLLWEGLTGFVDLPDSVFPGPFRVLVSLWELIADGSLMKHSIASLFRVTVGFYLAIFAALPLGIIIGRMVGARHLLNALIQFLRPISPLAWIPLAMLWFGIGDKPAIFLIFLSSFFPLVVSISSAASTIENTYFQVAANFNFSPWEVATRIIFPAMLPEMLTALRISLGIAWLVVVAAEMIAVKSGLGYLILDARNALRMDYVLVGMVVIGCIGLLLDLLMKHILRFDAVSWGQALH